MPCTSSQYSRDRAKQTPGRCSLAWVVCGSVALAACNAVMGFEEGSMGSPPGAAGSGGGAEGGGATGGGATGGGSIGTEGCLDSVDNNGDGRADCEDPQCVPAYRCVEPVGPDQLGGWLHVGNAPPACGGGTLIELFDPADLDAAPASCECGCEDAVTSCLATVRCGYTCGLTDYSGAAADSCGTMNVTTDDYHCWAHNLRDVMDACAPVGEAELPLFTWPAAAWLCQWPSGGHCPGEESCVPAPEPGGIGPCAASTTDDPCPAELPYRLEYADGSVADSRNCSAANCSCNTPTGGSCTCTSALCGVELYSSSACLSAPHAVALIDGDCVNKMTISPPGLHDMGMVLVGASVTAQGTCTPSGTTSAAGEVVADGTYSVCCAEAPPDP